MCSRKEPAAPLFGCALEQQFTREGAGCIALKAATVKAFNLIQSVNGGIQGPLYCSKWSNYCLVRGAPSCAAGNLKTSSSVLLTEIKMFPFQTVFVLQTARMADCGRLCVSRLCKSHYTEHGKRCTRIDPALVTWLSVFEFGAYPADAQAMRGGRQKR